MNKRNETKNSRGLGLEENMGKKGQLGKDQSRERYGIPEKGRLYKNEKAEGGDTQGKRTTDHFLKKGEEALRHFLVCETEDPIQRKRNLKKKGYHMVRTD